MYNPFDEFECLDDLLPKIIGVVVVICLIGAVFAVVRGDWESAKQMMELPLGVLALVAIPVGLVAAGLILGAVYLSPIIILIMYFNLHAMSDKTDKKYKKAKAYILFFILVFVYFLYDVTMGKFFLFSKAGTISTWFYVGGMYVLGALIGLGLAAAIVMFSIMLIRNVFKGLRRISK